jgi:hypothetical protein
VGIADNGSADQDEDAGADDRTDAVRVFFKRCSG